MCDNLPGVMVRFLQHGFRDADLGVGEERGQPLAVDVDTVPYHHVVLQGQAETMADHLGGVSIYYSGIQIVMKTQLEISTRFLKNEEMTHKEQEILDDEP